MGIEPMTPVLPRLCAAAAPHGPTLTCEWVGSGGFEPPKLSQLIYSQSHLTALVTAQVEEHTSFLSDRRSHYSRPFVPCQVFFAFHF